MNAIQFMNVDSTHAGFEFGGQAPYDLSQQAYGLGARHCLEFLQTIFRRGFGAISDDGRRVPTDEERSY